MNFKHSWTRRLKYVFPIMMNTHGLPIEQVLANKGVKRKEMSMAEYLERTIWLT